MTHPILIPAPNGTIHQDDGVMSLPDIIRVSRPLAPYASVFSERIARLGDYRVVPSERSGGETILWERPVDGDWNDEEYRLRIGRQDIRIIASTGVGAVQALTTLIQLVASGNGRLPLVDIHDKPRFAWRGLSLDVCRHFFAVDDIKRVIEQCALLKMNRFHWHLSDDQGYRIESSRFPELNTIGSWRKLDACDPLVDDGRKAGDTYGGYYTREQIRDVVDYAAQRGITVVPELELPGHATALLAAHPELSCSGDPVEVSGRFGVHDRIFCAGNDRTLDFLFALTDEIADLFDTPYIHLGGDEAPKSEWKRCPACGKRMEQVGANNWDELQSWFCEQVVEHVKSLGKTAITWNEATIGGRLDETALVQYWTEMAPGPSYMLPELERGRSVISSSMNSFYCDYSYADIPLRGTLMYEPEVKGNPIPKRCAHGIEATMWTEWTSDFVDVERLLYPRLLAVAECGWTERRDPDEFLRRAERFLAEPLVNVLEPMPWNQATIHGDDALKAIVSNMIQLGRRYASSGGGEAVMPEDAAPVDPKIMMRMFMESKMRGAYTNEDIDKVVDMLSSAMQH